MQLLRKSLSIIILFTTLSFSEKQKIRQIIVYKAPLYLKPGLKIKNYIKTSTGRIVARRKKLIQYISGGNLIKVISAKRKNKEIYLKFNYKNNNYFVLKKYTGERPQDLRPGVTFSVGKEKTRKPLPFYYEPQDLKEISGFSVNGRKVFLRKPAATAFISMAMDAQSKDINLRAHSGFISIGMYARKYYKLKKIWGAYLPRHMSYPGKSVMHTGVYLDVTSKQNRYFADDHFVYTKAYKWLIKNSQYYGFHFLNFTNPLDYRSFRLRYTGKTSLIFKVQDPIIYENVFNNESVVLKKFEKSGLKVNYLVIHDNENTATRALKYALKKYGGYAIELVNRLKLNRRNIIITVGSDKLEVDPNRIFTDANALQDMRMWNEETQQKKRKKALEAIRIIRNEILKAIKLNEARYLIAIHSNKRYGNLNIHSFRKRSIRKRYYIYFNRKMHKKSFFYVISKSDFNYFKKKKFNVVCPKKWDGKDGSLAFVAMNNKKPYITIESAELNDLMERKMVDVAIELVKTRYSKWQKPAGE